MPSNDILNPLVAVANIFDILTFNEIDCNQLLVEGLECFSFVSLRCDWMYPRNFFRDC